MNFPSNRVINLAAAVGCALLIVVAIVYFQNHLVLEPCYLCITQRVFVIGVGIIFLLAGLIIGSRTLKEVDAIDFVLVFARKG